MSAVGLADRCCAGLLYGVRSCMEPIVSAGLVYLAHRTMPFLSWTPHTGCCPFSALRGHHEHHHTFNNPSRRPSSRWRRLLRTGTLVGKKEIDDAYGSQS